MVKVKQTKNKTSKKIFKQENYNEKRKDFSSGIKIFKLSDLVTCPWTLLQKQVTKNKNEISSIFLVRFGLTGIDLSSVDFRIS